MLTAIAGLLAILAAPTATVPENSKLSQEVTHWRHEASGVILPITVADMRKAEERDLSRGAASDVILQYGTDLEPVTLWVYHGAYPNPAIWMERTRAEMITNVGAPGIITPPRAFTMANAPGANGLRGEYTANKSPWKATAVAIVQLGEWTFKARITSSTLDTAGVGAKMDRLLAAVRFVKPVARTPVMILPAPCGKEAKLKGKLIAPTAELRAAALVNGIVPMMNARGRKGLTMEPEKWCRAEFKLPRNAASLAGHIAYYRLREGQNWILIIGDAGRAISGGPLETDPAHSAIYTHGPSGTKLAAISRGTPDPAKVLSVAFPVVAGMSAGLGSIGVASSQPAAAVEQK